jgi:hypothetical protein
VRTYGDSRSIFAYGDNSAVYTCRLNGMGMGQCMGTMLSDEGIVVIPYYMDNSHTVCYIELMFGQIYILE